MTVAQAIAALGELTATGASTGDDMILAIDPSPADPTSPPDANTNVSGWTVAQVGIKSQKSSLNPETKTVAYIRQGKSTVKTGNQRTINFEWDRVIGDAFQEFVDDHDKKYAKGNDALVNYVWFNARSLSGEIGQGSLIIDTDADSTPEENLGGSGSIQKYGADPVAYTYIPSNSSSSNTTQTTP